MLYKELNALGGTLSFSTDSFVIDPIFFRVVTFGKLAVCGTANDVAVCGAVPKYLSCGFILEEGLPLETLKNFDSIYGKSLPVSQYSSGNR